MRRRITPEIYLMSSFHEIQVTNQLSFFDIKTKKESKVIRLCPLLLLLKLCCYRMHDYLAISLGITT